LPYPIQSPGVGSALTRLFRLTGIVRPRLEESVLPVVLVADISQPRTPEVLQSAHATFNQAAVAAESCVFRFEVPPSVVARIDEVTLLAGPAATSVPTVLAVNFGSTIAAPANTALKEFTDQRAIGAPAGVLTFGTSAAGLGVAIRYRIPLLAGGLVYRPRNWIVFGDQAAGLFGFLEFDASIVNTEFRVGLRWSELVSP
jgi:hypothetical protein